MNINQERQIQQIRKNIGELLENKNTPIIDEVDVIVAGGGVAGITSAVAASRNGAKVILIEQAGYLGGYITGGLVNYITPYKDWYERIVGGLAEEIVENMRKIGAMKEGEYDVLKEHPWLATERNWKRELFGNTEGLKRFGVQLDTEKLKVLIDDMVTEAGVQVFLHTSVVDVKVENMEIKTVILESKSGRFAINAKVFIDCTGDGNMAARAGAEFQKGRPLDGKMLPVTTMFRLRGVQVEEAMKYQFVDPSQYGYANLIKQAREKGELDIPHCYILVRPTIYNDGLEVNGTRITDIDGTNVFELTKAEIILRKQAI